MIRMNDEGAKAFIALWMIKPKAKAKFWEQEMEEVYLSVSDIILIPVDIILILSHGAT